LLAKKASDRFQSGKELAEAIQSFLKDGQQAPVKSGAESKDNTTKTDLEIPSDGFDEQSFELNDNFEINRRIDVMPESSGRISKIVISLLLVMTAGAGYQFRIEWVPEAQQLLGVNWFDSKELAPASARNAERMPQEQPSDLESKLPGVKKQHKGLKKTSNAETNAVSENTTASGKQVADLIQKANTLAQYIPHELSDIKQALDNLTRAKSIEPENKLVSEVKQTVIGIALHEADVFSTQNKYDVAEQWLEVVGSADNFNEDLALLKETIATRKYGYSQQLSNNQAKENQLRKLLNDATRAIELNRLSAPLKKNALYFLHEATNIDPNNPIIADSYQRIENKYVSLVESTIKTREFAKANRYLSKLRNLPHRSSDHASLISTVRKEKLKFDRIQVEKQRLLKIEKDRKVKADKRSAKLANPLTQMQLQSKLQSAADLMEVGNLVQPIGNNALEKYQAALEIDPFDKTALQGVNKIESTIITNIEVAISNSLVIPAEQWLNKLKLFSANDSRIDGYSLQLNEIKVINVIQHESEDNHIDGLDSNDSSVIVDGADNNDVLPENPEQNTEDNPEQNDVPETE